MAVNKNFVIKNGLEVDQRLILADANTQKVGIGSTGPRFELDVAGGIGATDSYIIGISTALEYFNVGLGGKVLSVVAGAGGIGTSKVGVGTSNPNYLLEVRSPVSTGQTALYVYGDLGVTGDLSVDDIDLDQANINRLYVEQSLDIVNPATLYVESGITTLGGYLDVNSNVDISGTLNVGGATTIGGHLNGTTANLTNISGTNLNYSGIGTINTLIVGSETDKATISYTTNIARNLTIPSLGGNRTFAFIDQDQTFSGNQNFVNINVSGISTLGNLKVSSGIVTATSGIVTFYGDGSGLINTPPGSPAGSINQVQYNNGGFFAGSSNLTHDGTTTRIVTGVITSVYGNDLYYINGSINTIFGNNINYSGIGTIATLNSTTANLTNISGTNLNYSGIGTIANLYVTGVVTSTSYILSGGTSDQFLKADGSVDSTPYTSTGKAIAMAIVFGG